MTDKEQFIAMLTRAGIEFKEEVEDNSRYLDADRPPTPSFVTIIVEGGYCGFFTKFKFQRDTGVIVSVEAYE